MMTVQDNLCHPNHMLKPSLTASQPFRGCNQVRSRKSQASFLLVDPIFGHIAEEQDNKIHLKKPQDSCQMSLSFDHSYAGHTGFDYYAVAQVCLRSAGLACRPFITWIGQFVSVVS